jgi:hypothetical protein
MVKRFPAPGSETFPWGLLAQAVLLVIAIIAEVVEGSKKR